MLLWLDLLWIHPLFCIPTANCSYRLDKQLLVLIRSKSSAMDIAVESMIKTTSSVVPSSDATVLTMGRTNSSCNPSRILLVHCLDILCTNLDCLLERTHLLLQPPGWNICNIWVALQQPALRQMLFDSVPEV